MKLFTPQQTKDVKNKELTRDILRAEEVQNIIKENNLRLGKSEADFELMIAGQKMRWERELKEHNKDIEKRKKEIEELEDKKANALIPIEIIKKGAENRMEESVKFMAELRQREQDAHDLTEKLEEKLDEVGEKETTLNQLKKKLDLRDLNLKSQEEEYIIRTKKLTDDMADFYAKKIVDEKSLDERITAIKLKEMSLVTKEEHLKNTENSLNLLAIKLKDDRETLGRAWAELERKKNIPLN